MKKLVAFYETHVQPTLAQGRLHLREYRQLYAGIARVAFVFVTGVITVIAVQVGFFWYHAPEPYPRQALIEIPAGMTLDQAARQLEKAGVVQSALLLRTMVLMQAGEASVQAGEYYFEEPENSWQIARRLVSGDLDLDPVVIRIEEGMTSYQMAEVFAEKLGRFDAVTFAERAKSREGYLFPDTYQFLPNATIEDVISTMEANFFAKISDLQPQIDAYGRPLHEIVTMASLLEREANTYESRRTVAGILWNRLEIDMPLQVDAVFGYIYGRETFHPRFSHLEVESPYNTYQNKGLPPGPIASPSLSALEAAVNPIKNDYLFYLTGRDGQMRYSQTYTQHMYNKRVYLD